MLIRWRRRPSASSSGEAAGAAVSTPVPMTALDERLASLRGLLTAERSRIRPDTFDLLWAVLEHTEGLRPSWDRSASVRAADAVQLSETLTLRVIPGLEDFLLPGRRQAGSCRHIPRRRDALGGSDRAPPTTAPPGSHEPTGRATRD